jgi:hypothetical protein
MHRTVALAIVPAVLLATASTGLGEKAAKSTTFTVRIEGVSTPQTLKLSTGGTAPAPVSPGIWAVHTDPAPLFVSGKADLGIGLERLAEDGDPTALAAQVPGRAGVRASGVINVPAGDTGPGPLLPGKSFEFAFTAAPGCNLSLAVMFGQSNDLFYAPAERGIALFDAKGAPISGDITSQLVLWDAGTEVNQEPGVGADQAPRQAAPNTGAAQKGLVQLVKDAWTYPATKDVVRITITPERTATMASR